MPKNDAEKEWAMSGTKILNYEGSWAELWTVHAGGHDSLHKRDSTWAAAEAKFRDRPIFGSQQTKKKLWEQIINQSLKSMRLIVSEGI